MKERKTPLTDQYLESLRGMKEPETDEFFYTRLKARMEKQQPGWSFPVRPAWLIGCLVVLLALNTFMLSEQNKTNTSTASSTPLQEVAEAYDLSISSY